MATNAVLFDSCVGNWFQTTIEVQQGCLLLPTLFNIFLERIMTDALEDHEGTVSIESRTINNLRFADDVDGLARGRRTGKISLASQQSLNSLRHGNQCREEQADDKQHQWYQHSDQSKWAEAWDCHTLQVPGLGLKWRGFQARDTLQDSTAALTMLKPVWNDRSISLSSKVWLMCSLVTLALL